MAAKKLLQEYDKLLTRVEGTIGNNEKQLREFLEEAQGRLGDLIELYEEQVGQKTREKDVQMENIIVELRKLTNVTAEAPDEKLLFPTAARYAKYNAKNTVHVDNFLYDDEALEELVRAKKLSEHYCLDCGSHKVALLNFISHSFSIPDLKFLFSEDCLGSLKDKTVLDIGSRLGCVLFYGAIYSKAKHLVGVEINKYFVDLQNQILDKNPSLKKKITIAHQDIFKVDKELISKCDVVIMHNVFEWFGTMEENKAAWQNIRNLFSRKGVKIVMYPALSQSLTDSGFTEQEVAEWHKQWVKQIPLEYPEEGCEDENCKDETCQDHKHDHDHEHDENCQHDHKHDEDEDEDSEAERIHLYEVL